MLFDDQEPCTSPNSQGFGQATSINIAPGDFAINMLFDEILLEIFVCYVEESWRRDAWHTLGCVCRRWRSIALGSPRRLNLRIFCSNSKRIPVRKTLDFWPPLPIVLTGDFRQKLGKDNILATLEHHDRVCDIRVTNISSSLWEEALPLIQKPFPVLTDLNLQYRGSRTLSVIPNLFLGGSAPRLRRLNLECIPFPGLPKLLLTATELVHLHLELYEIPDSGYFSADAIAACLSTMTRLESLDLRFESPRPRPEWERRRTPSSTRALLPSLTYFMLGGSSEHREDIVDRIDAPLLDTLTIRFHPPVHV